MNKTITKICSTCGNIFKTTIKNEKYCSKKCRADDMSMGGQLCWNCQRATGGCSWSDKFIPVNGWIAEPRIIKNYNILTRTYDEISTFRIKYCPLFLRDLPRNEVITND